MDKKADREHPTVFISYSHDSAEHSDKVLTFADKLRSDGIDAILDQYEPWPEEGWLQWMTQQVRKADFVLMMCTEMYYNGVMGDVEQRQKLGIKWEWNILSGFRILSEACHDSALKLLKDTRNCTGD